MEKNKRAIFWLIMTINVIGVICLVYFAVPYIGHDTTVANPDAMLPAEAWDEAGMALTFGLVPLVIANVLGYLFLDTKRKGWKFLMFVPSISCLALVISYWLTAIK